MPPGLGRRTAGEQGGGGFGVGEHADGTRAAYVEGVRLAVGRLVLLGQPGRDLGEGPVEVGEVLPVRADRRLADPGRGQRPLVDGDVPRLEGLEPGQLDLLGVEPHHRLADQPVQGDRADLLRDRRDGLVEVGGDVVGLAHDGLCDPACPPHRDLVRQHPVPHRRQPVPQHQRIADHRLPGGGGDPERGRERRPRIPGDRRARAGPGHRDRGPRSTSMAARRRAAAFSASASRSGCASAHTVPSTSRSVSRARTAADVSRTSAMRSVGVVCAGGP